MMKQAAPRDTKVLYLHTSLGLPWQSSPEGPIICFISWNSATFCWLLVHLRSAIIGFLANDAWVFISISFPILKKGQIQQPNKSNSCHIEPSLGWLGDFFDTMLQLLGKLAILGACGICIFSFIFHSHQEKGGVACFQRVWAIVCMWLFSMNGLLEMLRQQFMPFFHHRRRRKHEVFPVLFIQSLVYQTTSPCFYRVKRRANRALDFERNGARRAFSSTRLGRIVAYNSVGIFRKLGYEVWRPKFHQHNWKTGAISKKAFLEHQFL